VVTKAKGRATRPVRNRELSDLEGGGTMADQNSWFGGSSLIKTWQLYTVRFFLLFFGWGAVSLAFELQSEHLLLRTAGQAFIFSALVLFLFGVIGRLSGRTRGIALAFLALLGILLLIEVWRGGGIAHTRAPSEVNEATQ